MSLTVSCLQSPVSSGFKVPVRTEDRRPETEDWTEDRGQETGD
jgi:hypothetical protein